jgi:TRAM domain
VTEPELMGRTECNRIVNFAGEHELIGRMVDVKITEALPHSLRGAWPAAGATAGMQVAGGSAGAAAAAAATA